MQHKLLLFTAPYTSSMHIPCGNLCETHTWPFFLLKEYKLAFKKSLADFQSLNRILTLTWLHREFHWFRSRRQDGYFKSNLTTLKWTPFFDAAGAKIGFSLISNHHCLNWRNTLEKTLLIWPSTLKKSVCFLGAYMSLHLLILL